MRTRALTWLAALVTVAGLSAGCSGGDDPSEDRGLPSQAELTAYFDAVAGHDPAGLDTAAEVARSGSPARAYALLQTQLAAGTGPSETTVKTTGSGFEACGQDAATCVRYTDLEGADGGLVDFKVDDAALSDVLVDLTGQAPIDVDGLFTVQPEYAYRTPQQTLVVTVQLTAKELALQPLPAKAVYIEQQSVLSGAPTSATGATGATGSVAAGASGYVALEFADAADATLDGQVTLPVKVGGQSAQSVGFGLAPAS